MNINGIETTITMMAKSKRKLQSGVEKRDSDAAEQCAFAQTLRNLTKLSSSFCE